MPRSHRLFLPGLLILLLPFTAGAADNQWAGSGPFTTGLGNRVISALAATPDGTTVYAGTGSGTVFAYTYTPPTVATGAASAITTGSATLNGTVNAKGAATTVTFEFGETNSYGTAVTATGSPVTGDIDTAVSAPVAALACGTLYHFRARGLSSGGATDGSDLTFTTSACPTYTVTYLGNLNDGGAAPVDGTAYLAGATVTVSGNTGALTKSDAAFAGWNTAAGGGGTHYAAGATFIMAGDITLHAQWLAAPTALAASSPRLNGFTANWAGVAGATGYLLDVAVDGGFTTFVSGFTNKDVGSVTSYPLTGLSSDTSYFYRVRAFNNKPVSPGVSKATSPDSNTITVKTGKSLVVTNNSDSGPGSLRQTIADANPGDEITFTVTVTSPITVGSTLAIGNDLTISGPGAANLTLNGGGATQIFQVTGSSSFTLKNLTLANGNALAGGALLDNPAATTTITGCVFSGNSASFGGGAIAAYGTMTISDTRFSGNQGSPSSYGGAIYAGGGGLTITNCLFNGNIAAAGGAIANGAAIMTLTNVTMNGNSALATGGGIFASGGGVLSLLNATIAGNHVVNMADGQGGGVFVSGGGIVTIKNCIVADNTAPPVGGPDIFGAVMSQGHNLMGIISAVPPISGDPTGNITGNPLLGALADNRGPTFTMALLSASPAINAGTCTGAPAADQRGMSRPQNGSCDIGAYERGAPATLTVTGGTPQSAEIGATFATALTVEVADSLGKVLDGVSVAFAGPGSGAGIAAGGNIDTSATGIASFSATANATSGTYDVAATVNTLTANFALTNLKHGQTISFADPGTQIFGTTPTLTASASPSGLAPTFTSSTTGICTISAGGALAFVTTGTCTINADQAGDASYNPALRVTRSFTVDKGTAAIVLGSLSATYDGSAKAATATTAPLSLLVSFTYDGGAAEPIHAGSYAVVATIDDVNYGGTASGTLVIDKANQSIGIVSFVPTSLVVNGTASASATATSLLGVVFTTVTPAVCDVSGSTVTGVAVGACIIAANQPGNSDFFPAREVRETLSVRSAPGAPTIGTAAPGNRQATVNFTAPASDGGSAITRYTATAHPGGITAAILEPFPAPLAITVGGLTNLTEYTFTVTATNAIGTGAASTESLGVTPDSAPTDIALGDNIISSGLPTGTPVGTLSTTDDDAGDTFAYALVGGPGSADNASFQIAGATLQSAVVFDAAVRTSYTVRVRSTDRGGAGLWTEKVFSITVSPTATDILWSLRNAGYLYVWHMDGVTSTNGEYLVPDLAPTNWQVAGRGDFNGDGDPDILWRETAAGYLYVWYMAGATKVGGEYVSPAQVPTSWVIAGIRDFNGDHKPDLLWRDTSSGSIYVWYMNGATRAGGEYLTPSSVPSNWVIAGTGDFNGDGSTDLLWRESAGGYVYVWYMAGSVRTGGSYVSPSQVSTNWEIAVVGDFTSDGKPDILWRERTGGFLFLWGMNGANQVSGSYLSPMQVPVDWMVVGYGAGK